MHTGHLPLADRYLAHHKDPPRRFRFTERVLAALPLPAKGQVPYRDEITPGFICRCTPTARTLYVARRQRGAAKVKFVRLGVVGDKPLAEFRAEAENIGAKLASGLDPTALSPKRGALTLGGAFDALMLAKTGRLAPATIKSYNDDFEAFCGSWRSRVLASISGEDVLRRHRERSIESPARADGALRVLRMVERYARACATDRGEVYAGHDLLSLVRASRAWNNRPRRATYLDNGRRAAWIAAVRALPDDDGVSLTGTQRDALLLLAVSGLRLREALRLTWAEVDLRAAVLTLGADRMKGARAHALPIPKRTLAMLKARRALDPEGKYVFAGPAGPLDRISKRLFALIPTEFTPHDLRRTCATWLGANAPGYVVKAMLSHADSSRSSDVTVAYVLLDPDALRPWLQQWENVLFAKPATGRRRG